MHGTAMENGKRFFETYAPHMDGLRVLDVGAQNVNGSLREVCPRGATYIGVDFEAGKDVDVILSDPYTLPFSDGSFDAVVCTSCFEHSEMFWLTHLEILRVIAPTGLFYLNVPSNGPCHRYPVDCWRFYPDSGLALANWGRRAGFDKCAVLESYIGSAQILDGGVDHFNDFVCVFVKDESHADRYPNRILRTAQGFTNGFVRGKDGQAMWI